VEAGMLATAEFSDPVMRRPLGALIRRSARVSPALRDNKPRLRKLTRAQKGSQKRDGFQRSKSFLGLYVPNRKSVAYSPIDWVGSHGGFSQKHRFALIHLGRFLKLISSTYQPRPNKAVDTNRIPAAEFALHETTTLTRMTYRASDIR
jgi:hypothetical protein